MPRKSVKLDRLKSMSPECDTNEYLVTNEARIFGGNALELMTTMYKAEQLPVRVRLYAASKAVEFENQNGKSIEEIRAEILQELKAEGDDSLDRLVDDLKRHRAVIIEYRDLQLQAWIEDGTLSEAAAAKVRDLWADKGDRPWPSRIHLDNMAMPDLPPGPHTRQMPRISEICPPSVVVRKVPEPPIIDAEDGIGYGPAGDGAVKAAGMAGGRRTPPPPSSNSPQPKREPNAATLVFYTRPFACFQTHSGRRFEAAADGSIAATDPDDVEDLLRVGCRTTRAT
jgi:hypothetical protein